MNTSTTLISEGKRDDFRLFYEKLLHTKSQSWIFIQNYFGIANRREEINLFIEIVDENFSNFNGEVVDVGGFKEIIMSLIYELEILF